MQQIYKTKNYVLSEA